MPKERVHPGIEQSLQHLHEGRVSRREFLRVATLLGMSLPAATLLASCGTALTPVPNPAASTSGAIKRGGVLRVGMQIPMADHPARLIQVAGSNIFRLVFEYLTETGPDNITRPQLLAGWEANDDLTTWTLNVKPGITWTNGDELIADHIVYNFNEWLNPDVGSSILGLWDGFLDPSGIEVVDQYTLRLNLQAPKLDVPETLYHHPALIMHPSFNGDITTGQNPSTGPYLLESYRVGENARIVARTDGGYWQVGVDDAPLPYLDAIEYISLGDEQVAYVAALQAGEIDTIMQPTVETWEALRDNVNVAIYSVDTGQTRVLRMRTDLAPWDNVNVRNALKKCQDHAKIVEIALNNQGLPGQDFHVSPVHPEYAPITTPTYDPEGARALLTQAGYADGLDVEIAVGSGWPDVVNYIETLQQDAAPAGINITLNTMPNTTYWEQWKEVAVGVTPWAHRPLAITMLAIAYIADDAGEPVAWNETRWNDAEFNQLVKQAQGTLDVEARRQLMGDIQRIMQERGAIGVPYWMRVWEVFNPAFQDVVAHPTQFSQWQRIWYDPERDPRG